MLLGIGIIYLVFKGNDSRKMMSSLKNIKLVPVILSFIMGYVAYVNRGIRWVYMIKSMGYKIEPLHGINAVSLTYFTNLLLPRAGEIARCTAINKTHNIPLNKLMGTVIMERIIDFMMLFVIIGITMIAKFNLMIKFLNTVLKEGRDTGDFTFAWVSISILGICLILFFVLKNKIKTTKGYKAVTRFVMGIREGIETIKGIEQKKYFIFHTISIWLMYILMVYAVFYAIDETSYLSFGDCLFVFVVGALAMIVPVPGGIGAYHAATMLGLMMLGIDRHTSLFFATVVHTTQTLVAVLFGSIALIMITLRKRKSISIN